MGIYAFFSKTTGYSNSAMGYDALYTNIEGRRNSAMGFLAGYHTKGSGNVFLGHGAGYSETGSNKLYIANGLSDPNVIIYGDFSGRRVGIATTSPSERLDVNGTARLRGIANGSGTTVVADNNGKLWKQSSSKRYKTNIETLATEAEDILQLRPVSFQHKSTGQSDIGLIAEEVEEQVKDLVIYDNQGRPDAVKYDRLAVLLLEVIKTQQQRIADLEEEVGQNKSLRERIEALEKTIQ